jgi:hypothetical protein
MLSFTAAFGSAAGGGKVAYSLAFPPQYHMHIFGCHQFGSLFEYEVVSVSQNVPQFRYWCVHPFFARIYLGQACNLEFLGKSLQSDELLRCWLKVSDLLSSSKYLQDQDQKDLLKHLLLYRPNGFHFSRYISACLKSTPNCKGAVDRCNARVDLVARSLRIEGLRAGYEPAIKWAPVLRDQLSHLLVLISRVYVKLSWVRTPQERHPRLLPKAVWLARTAWQLENQKSDPDVIVTHWYANARGKNLLYGPHRLGKDDEMKEKEAVHSLFKNELDYVVEKNDSQRIRDCIQTASEYSEGLPEEAAAVWEQARSIYANLLKPEPPTVPVDGWWLNRETGRHLLTDEQLASLS